MAAIKTFTVFYGGIRIRVRLLKSPEDVHLEHQRTARQCRDGTQVRAFFLPNLSPTAKYAGTIVLPMEGRLLEWVPHEVSHAVIHAQGGVLARDDEEYCKAVGMLCAGIFRHIDQIRAEVRYA